MTAVSHPRTGPAGLAGLAGVLAVIGLAGLALLLGSGSSPAVVAPAPAAPHGASEASGTILYGRYLGRSGADNVVRGLTMTSASGRSLGELSHDAVCCASLGGRNVLFTRRTARGTQDLLATTRPGGTVTARLALPWMMLGPGVLSPDGSRIAVWATDRRHRGRGVLEIRAGGRWYQIGKFGSRPVRPLSFSPDGSHLLVYRPRVPAYGDVDVVAIASGRYERLTPPGMASWCCYFGSPASLNASTARKAE